ncbi:hypothetical protein STAQ_29200 [Allostella sp. ATCC 35155]|nr:hypothetical protein STAQ_29200 [Stella sp. ATCC 35155]
MAVIASDPIVVATAPETEPNTPPYSLSAPILTALPGDGFAVAWSLYHQPVGGQSGESETFLRLYDSDGDETATLPIDFPAGHIATSTAGTIALMGGGGAGTIAVQVFDFEGVPIAAEQTIFGEGSSAIYSRTIDLAAIPDGGYTAIWRWTEDLGPPASQLRIIGPDGMAEPTAVDLGEEARSTAQALVVADDEIKVIAAIGEGTRYSALFRFSRDGESLAEPKLIETSDGERFAAADFDRLANGDFSVAMVDRTDRAAHAYPDRLLVQRIDGAGEPIGAVVEVSTPQRIETDPVVAPLQNGGFVAVWAQFQTGNLVYRIFDADGTALTDEATIDNRGIETSLDFDVDTLDDGRFVVSYAYDDDAVMPWLATDNTILAQVFDHEPSRTATPGGTVAVVETWQDQLAIDRDDGIDTLVTSDSLALLPFIPNLTMAGTADLNADANDMANFLIGNDGNNILVGYLGNDVMHGHGGDDFLAMGRGNDVADTGDGQNTVWGGQGDDSIQGGNGDDILNGDRHDDVIDGGAGDDRINGGSHDDLLTGNDGDDSITGGAGADTLEGWDGADTLRGDRDDDQLEGGDGADRFVFGDISGNDTVLDFRWTTGASDNDRIVVEVEDGMINGVAITSVTDLWARSADSLHGFRVDLGDGNAVTLMGQIRSSLSPDMFELVVV